MSKTAWLEWLRTNTRGISPKEIAAAAGIDRSGVSRWLDGSVTPKVENIVSFARNIGKPPVEALVAAGYLTRADAAAVIEVSEPLSARPDEELLAEVAARMALRPAVPKIDHISDRLAATDDDGEGIENNL